MASTHFDSSLLVANYDWNADRPIPTKKRSYVRKKLDAVEGDAPMPRPSNASPSLAPVTVTEVTDADIGLETTKTTQKSAEEFVRSAISFTTWKATKDRQRATEVKAKRLEMIREAAARIYGGSLNSSER